MEQTENAEGILHRRSRQWAQLRGPGGRGGFRADGDGVSSDATILPECMFSVLSGMHPGVKNRRVPERGCRLEQESTEDA